MFSNILKIRINDFYLIEQQSYELISNSKSKSSNNNYWKNLISQISKNNFSELNICMRSKKMKNDSLIKLIKDYVSKSNIEGALYINGSWGSGKTYFLNSFINKENKKNDKKYCYISLSGMKTTTDIISEIFASIHPKLASLKNSKITKIFLTIGKGVGNFFGIDNSTTDEFLENIKSFFDGSNVGVLLLDDFERCRIDLQDLFGFINSLISNNNIKIILIGYDKEVRNYLKTESDFQNRLILAAASDGVKEFEDALKKANDKILYDSIKEKYIYKTYDFIFDEEIFFSKIVKDYSPSLQKIIKQYNNEILRILKEEGCDNLRTCKSAVENYQYIVKRLPRHIKNIDYIKSRILLTCFYYTVLYKNGEKMDSFSTEKYYGNEVIYPIISVGNYIYNSAWNSDAFYKAITEIDSNRTLALANKIPDYIVVFYSNWYAKTDEELKQQIKTLYDKIDEIPFRYYFNAINYFYTFNEWFPNDEYKIDDIINRFCNIIKSSTTEIEYNEHYTLFEIPKNLISYYQTIEKAFIEHNKAINSKTIQLSNDNLKQFIEKDLPTIEKTAFSNKSFFDRLDMDNLVEIIKEGTSQNIIDMRSMLKGIYKSSNIGEFFEGDKNSLSEFNSRLNLIKADISSVIKKRNIDLLHNDIEDYIKKLDINHDE